MVDIKRKKGAADKMPPAERKKLEATPEAELNQMTAAFFLGIGRSTLANITAAGAVRVVRPSTRIIRYRVADLLAYEASVTSGGPATPTTKKGAN